MPNARLWLVNYPGTAFYINTSQDKFTQLENTWDDSVPVKRLSSCDWCAWCVGHDHRVYIYVLSSDVPIRVPETTYENQRWTPFHGFSKTGMLPTDRFPWSDESGIKYRPRENLRLPSAHWDWDGDWMIDENLRGEVVGIEGWQYAFDFPAVYTPEKHWNSCVRRRKWLRFRCYSSTDVWARISDMEIVERAECFIDISVGGFQLPCQKPGFLSVWGVTNNGYVYVRTNVNKDNPEGSTWKEVPLKEYMGVINIAVGTANLVWAVTWDGHALVRTRVTRDNVYGSGWTLVDYPDEFTRLMQVAVGKNVVWALSREGKVWFRKGTTGEDMFWSHESAVGSSWVEMVGEMQHLAVSANDQVFAIGLTDNCIYFRTGISRSDLTGKTWQKINFYEDLAPLEREGHLSEGVVCYCDSIDTICPLHGNRPRLSSTTTSSSSISNITNLEDSSSDIVSPSVPAKSFTSAAYTRSASLLDSLPVAYRNSSAIELEDSLEYENKSNILNTKDNDVESSTSSEFVNQAEGEEGIIFPDSPKPSQSSLTLTSSLSPQSTLSQDSESDEFLKSVIEVKQKSPDNSPELNIDNPIENNKISNDDKDNELITSELEDKDRNACSPYDISSRSVTPDSPADMSDLPEVDRHLKNTKPPESTQTSTATTQVVEMASEQKVQDKGVSSTISSLISKIHPPNFRTILQSDKHEEKNISVSSANSVISVDSTNASVVQSIEVKKKASKQTNRHKHTKRPKVLELQADSDPDSIVFSSSLGKKKNKKKVKTKNSLNSSFSDNEKEFVSSLSISSTITIDSLDVSNQDLSVEKLATDDSGIGTQTPGELNTEAEDIHISKTILTKNKIEIVDSLDSRIKPKSEADILKSNSESINVTNELVSESVNNLEKNSHSEEKKSHSEEIYELLLENKVDTSGETDSLSIENVNSCVEKVEITGSPLSKKHGDDIPTNKNLNVNDLFSQNDNCDKTINKADEINVCDSKTTESKNPSLSFNENSEVHIVVQDKSDVSYKNQNVEKLGVDIPKSEKDLSPKGSLARQDSFESQQSQKSAGFANRKFGSLNSSSASDEIIDFVTGYSSEEDDEPKDVFRISSDEVDKKGLPHESVRKDSVFLGENLESRLDYQSQTSHISSGSAMTVSTSLGEETEASDSDVNTTALNSSLESQTLRSMGISTRKSPLYRKSPAPSTASTSDVFPLTALSVYPAQDRLSWKYLDATSCVIDDPSSVKWLLHSGKEPKKKKSKISKQIRDSVLKKIKERNKREVLTFSNYEEAIVRTSWVKKAVMQVYSYSRSGRWYPSNVELEQGMGPVKDGCLTVSYHHKHSHKGIQMALDEITCVKVCSDPDLQTTFTVYTSLTNIIHEPLMLKANSETEAHEWIGYLCYANASKWNLDSPIDRGSVWSTTFIGDIFASPATQLSEKPFDLCWGQQGGHLRQVETGPSGVTWGVGFDKMPYCYNGGFGGAVNVSMSGMSENLQPMMDFHRVFVYENQKWFPVAGWCSKGVLSNDFHWVTETGKAVASKESVKLPSSKWQWTGDWEIDFSSKGGVEKHGWQFSNSMYGHFHPKQHVRDLFRRRRWMRRCKLSTSGPWKTAGSLGLLDISVQIDPVVKDTDPVIVWAVGANGDVLCRYGVTSLDPLGHNWIHVATDLDKPFRSISVGGSFRVWGIASDGSAWYRPGISPSNPAGKCWLQVVPPPPSNSLLRQVSAGATAVWAVDTRDNLWRRENITPTFPEGTGWEFVSSRVKSVSVGPKDQVWVVADSSFSKLKHASGVIYNRTGITSHRPEGNDWEVVIGSGWAHVCVRGVSDDV